MALDMYNSSTAHSLHCCLDAKLVIKRMQDWHNEFGKDIWLTEYGCWVSAVVFVLSDEKANPYLWFAVFHGQGQVHARTGREIYAPDRDFLQQDELVQDPNDLRYVSPVLFRCVGQRLTGRQQARTSTRARAWAPSTPYTPRIFSPWYLCRKNREDTTLPILQSRCTYLHQDQVK